MVAVPESGLKAYNKMLAGLCETGRESAQMIGLALPLDETLVKNPPFCPVLIVGDWANPISFVLGEVSSFHTFTRLRPLVTTVAAPQIESPKYDSPHQQPP